MSLFKAREWWSAKSGFEELHDLGLLAVGNIDNTPAGFDKIIIGSFQGFIRIFEPHPPTFAASHVILEKELGMPIIQLGLGQFLQESMQYCLCVLSPHRILVFTLTQELDNHGNGRGEEETTPFPYTLLPLYSHQLRRTAANMVWGKFERHNNVDQVCVQSMDGQLSFFSQSSHSFSCFMPDFLLPGPLSYLPHTSTLVTANSSQVLHFYKYQSLAVAGHRDDQEDDCVTTDNIQCKSSSNIGNKIVPERVVNLGEHVVQIQVVQDPAGSSQLLVLGERSLYCLSQNGVVRFMKKLEVSPSCFWAYHVTTPTEDPAPTIAPCSSDIQSVSAISGVKSVSAISGVKSVSAVSGVKSVSGISGVKSVHGNGGKNVGVRAVRSVSAVGSGVKGAGGGVKGASGAGAGVGAVRSMLASHCNQLLVLQDDALIWTASLSHTPVHLTTANFKDLRGVIVSLDEGGRVICSYLGTDPTIFKATTSARASASYQVMEKELNCLNKAIKNSKDDTGGGEDKVTLKMSTQVDPDLVRMVEVDELLCDGDSANSVGVGGGEDNADSHRPVPKYLDIEIYVQSSGGPLCEVTVSVTASLPLTTHPSHFTLPEVSSSTPPSPLVLMVVCTPSLLPISTSILLSATYTTQYGHVEAVEQEVCLPLHLFCDASYPDKNALFKVTVDTIPCEGNLSYLFPSPLLLDEVPPHAMGLQYLCGPTVTVVSSKTTNQRYRLQSDSLPALGVTLTWLLTRLHDYYSGSTAAFSAHFTPPLPLSEYFEIIEHHFKTRKDLEHCGQWLGRHAHQFRSIQKRLLTRFKDKTPVGLAHLDTLLDGTYMQLDALIDKSEVLELELQAASNQLSCASLLIISLLRLSANLGQEDISILTASFCVMVGVDASEQGWEELVEAGVMHLLQTSLAKASKDSTPETPPLPSLQCPKDCQKLKKHIALLCDRILKGYKPSGGRNKGNTILECDNLSNVGEVN